MKTLISTFVLAFTGRMARKQIVITDRAGLKAAANGTYHQPEKSTRLS
jgi:hypothetical protein